MSSFEQRKEVVNRSIQYLLVSTAIDGRPGRSTRPDIATSRTGRRGAVRDDRFCHPLERARDRGRGPRLDLGELGSRFQGESYFAYSLGPCIIEISALILGLSAL